MISLVCIEALYPNLIKHLILSIKQPISIVPILLQPFSPLQGQCVYSGIILVHEHDVIP
jgi:hypothetical protein